MDRALRLLGLAVLLTSLLGACAGMDGWQSQVCRRVIPALNGAQDKIVILGARALPSRDGLHIDYRVTQSQSLSRARYIECRFAARNRANSARDELVGVRTEEGALGDVRLRLLQRFWLDAEGARADPEPVAGASLAPEVSRGLALVLQAILGALPSTSIYALLAAAYALIYGLVGRINFAFGELAAVGGYVTFLGFAIIGIGLGVTGALVVSLLLVIAAGLAYGVASARFVFMPLIVRDGLSILIGTIGLSLVLQESLRLAQGPRLLWLQPIFNAPYAVARADDFLVTVTPVAAMATALCAVAGCGLILMMRATRFGRAWRACRDDPLAAKLCGTNRDHVLIQTFVLASTLACLAGYVTTISFGTLGFAGGAVLGIKALLAAVAGGFGTIAGAFLGGLMLGTSEAVCSALLPIEERDIAVLVLMSVLIVVRPHGLFGLAGASTS